jgi:hypothetical protein
MEKIFVLVIWIGFYILVVWRFYQIWFVKDWLERWHEKAYQARSWFYPEFLKRILFASGWIPVEKVLLRIISIPVIVTMTYFTWVIFIGLVRQLI